MSHVEHVILLMFENRSFDHILGDLPGVDGAKPSNTNVYRGKSYAQEGCASDRLHPGPSHEYASVRRQIDGAMGGFVDSYAEHAPHISPEQLGEVMRFFSYGTLPAFHKLATSFVTCDRWFSSVPGPTWPNRLFALSGTSKGRVTMPESITNLNLHFYDQRTLFDALDERNKTWKVYCGDFPLSFLLVNQLKPANAARYSRINTFYKDVAAAYTTDTNGFPDFTLIEPSYLWRDADDAHPPHDMQQADSLLASVYNALRSNEALWEKSLLVVLFDEHGGFYDHVPPPKTVAPDGHSYDYDFAFDELGVRVPALLISPWLRAGTLGSPSDAVPNRPRIFDHTSLLRYVSDLFSLTPPLGRRALQANTFANNPADQANDVFLEKLRNDTPPQIVDPPLRRGLLRNLLEEIPSGLSNAIVGLSHYIETISGASPDLVKERSHQMLSGHQVQFDIAVDRASDFIRLAKKLG